jgi:hypothetical protein
MSFLTSGSRSRRRDNHRPVVTYRSVWPVQLCTVLLPILHMQPSSEQSGYEYKVRQYLQFIPASYLMSVLPSNPLYAFISSPIDLLHDVDFS